MEINEEVTSLEEFIAENKHCKKKKEPPYKGKCRIGDPGSPGDEDAPTPERLYQNMVDAEVELPDKPPRKKGLWDLYKCTEFAFPFQSHHLIPKKHLPKRDVCMWLAKQFNGKKYKLTGSTDYDTDDAQNGMPLPFVSTTYQWNRATTEAKKSNVCNWMMHLTKLQLHQGSHTYKDYGEEAELHATEKTGYLGAVNQLLETVHNEALAHYKVCDDCKSQGTANPVEIRPLRAVVAHMYQVSMLMGQIITSRKRFVSRRAANYVKPKPDDKFDP